MLVTFAQAALVVVSVDKMSYNSSYISHYSERMMPSLSIRIPDTLNRRLQIEARMAGRNRSDLARHAIEEYIKRRESERFRAEIARAASEIDPRESLSAVEEALSLDNEALALVDDSKQSRGKDG